jgi:hypothetical protein
VHDHTIEAVGPEGAAGAALLPVGPEHEVVDEQLAAPVEQVRQGARAVGIVEAVLLLDRYPGEPAPRLGQRVTTAVEVLLLGE